MLRHLILVFRGVVQALVLGIGLDLVGITLLYASSARDAAVVTVLRYAAISRSIHQLAWIRQEVNILVFFFKATAEVTHVRHATDATDRSS